MNENDDLPKLPPLEDVLKSAKIGEEKIKESTIIIPQGDDFGRDVRNCFILERKTGDGRIEIVNGRVVCEQYRVINKDIHDNIISPYSYCNITKTGCPYGDIRGYN